MTNTWMVKRTVLALVILLIMTACESSRQTSAEYLEKAQAYFDQDNLIKAKIEVRNSLQVNPKNARARYLLALINEQEEDVRGVIGNLLIAIDSDPAFFDARLRLGNYYLVGRRPQEAAEQVEALLELAPDNAAAHLLRGRVALYNGDRDTALAAGQRALELDPGLTEAVSWVALLHARNDDLETSMAVIDAAIVSAAEPDAEALRASRIRILTEVGERDRAIAELESMARDYPQAMAYPTALAELYVAVGRTNDAEALLNELIARDSDNPRLRVQLATVLAGVGRDDEAEASLEQAIAESPDATELKFALAAFYESRDRDAEAMVILEDIAALDPRSSDGLAARNRLVALTLGEDDAKARQLVSEILSEVPDNVDALLYRSSFRIRDGEYDLAISDLRSALVREPASTRALLALARAYLLDGDPILAEDAYRRVVDIEPGNRDALTELAVLLGNRGQTEEAEQLLRRASRLGPEDAAVSRNLVNALLMQEDYAGAEAESRRMVELGPGSGVANYQLGVALEAQGKNDEAIEAYRTALTSAPTADEPLIALMRLYGRAGRHVEARDWLESHLRDYPDHLQAQLLLGEVYAATGDRQRAEQYLRQLANTRPNEPVIWVGLAGLHAEGSEERLAIITEGRAKNPSDLRLGLALGATYEKRADYERAIETYEDTLSVAGDNDVIANNLAALLLDYRADAASHARALELAERFDARDSHPLSVAVLGWAHYRTGDYAQAVRHLERAVAAVGQLPQLHYYLGMAYLKTGNSAGARQELQTAVDGAAAGNPFTGLEEARQALAGLESSGA